MFCSEAGLRWDGSADCVNPRTAQALPGRNPPEPRLRPLSCLASSPRQTSGRAVPGHRRRSACRFASCCYSSSSSACNRAPRAIPHSRLGAAHDQLAAHDRRCRSRTFQWPRQARSCGHQCITGRRSCAGGGTDIAAEGESPIRDLVVPPFPPRDDAGGEGVSVEMCECDSVRLGRKGRVFLASILPASRPRAASLMVVRRMLRVPAPSMPVYKNYLARCPSHTMHIGCLTFLSNVVAYVCRLSSRGSTDGRFPTTGCPNDAPSGQGSSRSSPARCPVRPTAGAACCAASRAKPHFSGAMAPENSIHRLPHPLDEPTNKWRKGRKPPILGKQGSFR
jgi:hypothetical protein